VLSGLRHDDGVFVRVYPLAALVLASCVAPAIDRAGDRADKLVADAEARSRTLLSDAEARLRTQIAGIEDTTKRLTADAAEKAAGVLSTVDARLERQRVETLAEVDRQRRETLEAFRVESAAWREESARWRAQMVPLTEAVAAFTKPPNSQGTLTSSPTPPKQDGLPAEDTALLWTALAGTAFTFAKTGWRVWKAHKAAAA
jgi:vacuolar-type H+-ATPase subunit H